MDEGVLDNMSAAQNQATSRQGRLERTLRVDAMLDEARLKAAAIDAFLAVDAIRRDTRSIAVIVAFQFLLASIACVYFATRT